MDEPAEDSSVDQPIAGGKPRVAWGWGITALGYALVVAGVLHLTSATVGGRVHDFRDRRTYTEVKRAAHRAFPVTLCIGLFGIGLVVLGNRMRAPGRRHVGNG